MSEENRKTEDQLTKELKRVLEQLYEIFPGDREEKLKAIEARTRMVLKIFEELKDEKLKETLEMGKQGYSQAEIAEKVGRNKASISRFLSRRSILSVTQIRKMLRENVQQGKEQITDEEWADRTGVYPETIARIRQELEQKKQKKESEEQKPEGENGSRLSETTIQIIELARQGVLHEEIANRVGKSNVTVSGIANKNGIASVRAIRQELRKEESKDLSNEELASRLGVYPEAVERIRKELEQKKQKKESEEQKPEGENGSRLSETTIQILELARQGVLYEEIANRVGKSNKTISAIAKRNGVASVRAIRQELRKEESKDLSNEELASRLGVYPEAIKRIRQELKQTKKAVKTKKKPGNGAPKTAGKIKEKQEEEESESKENSKNEESEIKKAQELVMILDLAKKGIKHAVIAEKVGKSQPTIGKIARENGICTVREIVQMMRQPELEHLSNEEWAAKTGVYPETIVKIKEKLAEQKQTSPGKPVANSRKIILPTEEEARLIDLLKQAMPQIQIAVLHGLQPAWISVFAQEKGIASGREIRRILREEKDITDEKLAKRAGVYVETVARIRAEIEEEKKRPKQPRINYQPSKKTTNQTQKGGEPQAIPRGRLVKKIPQVVIYQAKPEVQEASAQKDRDLATKMGIPSRVVEKIKTELNRFPAVGAIARENKVSRAVVESILDEMKKDEYARTHTVVQYRTEMIKLRSSVSGKFYTPLEYRIDTLLNEFTQFLTTEDYAFLAYGYAKEKHYEKAIDVAERYLGLDTPSISGLEQKIREVLSKALEEKGKKLEGFEIE